MQFNGIQSPRGQLRVLVFVLMSAASIASAESPNNDASVVAMLRSEVHRLSSELLRHRAEFAQWKMYWMQVELQQVQAERQRLSRERQLIEREIGELDQISTTGSGAEDADRREELSKTRVPTLLGSEDAAMTRERELTAALNAESARIEDIQKRLDQLAAQAREGR